MYIYNDIKISTLQVEGMRDYLADHPYYYETETKVEDLTDSQVIMYINEIFNGGIKAYLFERV